MTAAWPAVTVNLGGPSQAWSRKEAVIAWTIDILSSRRPVAIFAQETFPEWLEICTDPYRVLTCAEPAWSVRSALVCLEDLDATAVGASEVANLGYHGSYVATARWSRPDGSEAVLASVHASPNYAEPQRYGWPAGAEVPRERDPGADRRWARGLWDSDFLLVTIRDLHLALGLPVVAAGDFNEALGDDPLGGTWGAEFFARVREYGLVSWLHERWPNERPTHGLLQLDHIVISEDARPLLANVPAPELDPAWAKPGAREMLSDHVPIWFTLS